MQSDDTRRAIDTPEPGLAEGAGSTPTEAATLSSDVLRVSQPPGDQRFPLSFTQEQFWLLARLNTGMPTGNLPWLIDTPAALDVAALKRSVQELVQRHESLRSRFVFEQGRPAQVVQHAAEIDLPVVSLEELPAGEQEPAMWRIIEAELRKPFDLDRGSPLRAFLVRRSGGLNKLALIVHHIAIDTVSAYNVLFPELISLYTAYASGAAPPPLPANLQMRHYALWQSRRAQEGAFAEHMQYWKRRLEDLPAALNMPTDRPRPLAPSIRGGERSRLLPSDLLHAVRLLGREEQSTVFTMLLAAFISLLYRYTDREDIFIGTFLADRDTAAKQSILGPLINTVVLRAKLSGDRTFRQIIRCARDVLAEAREHSELPFEVLVNELRPQRSPGQNPLFQVAFNYLHSARSDGWSITHRGATTGTTDIDLVFDLQNVPEGVRIHAQYSTDLFDASTIERMLGHYEVLLRGAVQDPETRLWALPLLTDGERRALHVWHDAPVSVPGATSGTSGAAGEGATFPRLFELQAERSPATPALIFGKEELSYQELNARANRLGRRLRTMGVGPESFAGICMDRSVDMVVALLAILKAGGAYVPLDPAYPPERLAYMVDDTRPQVLITHKRTAPSLPPNQSRIVLMDDIEREGSEADSTNLPPLASPYNLAYIIYTSGSTGRPKGVLIEHRGLSHLLEAQRSLFSVQPGGRMLQFASLSFDASIWEIATAIASGATLVLGTRDSLMPGAPLLSFLREQRISITLLPPSALSALSHALATPEEARELPLETLIVGGEACPPDLVARWAPGRRFFNAYGPTEITVYATLEECTSGDSKPLIGRPIKNMGCLILDSRGQPRPAGMPGELYIEGAGLARGYHNSPERTAEKFLPSTTVPGERMYRTGDLVRYMPDGRLDFLGRVDRQVKIRGFRIEPGEIEAALRRRPEVLDAVVVSVTEAQGDARLVAYVACGPQMSEADRTRALKEHLSSLLPSHMVPSVFVILDKLPTTPTGKVDLRALPSVGRRAQPRSAFEAPSSDVEVLIADIWKRVLGLSEVGVNDNFFDLGGTSLLLVRVHEAMRKAVAKPLSMLQLVTFPTIRSLAQALSGEATGSTALARAQDRARKQKLALEEQKQRLNVSRRKL